MRLVVKATDVAKLKVGSLYIVTCKGGTLGREGEHDVLIPDINVSKQHLKFYYCNNKFLIKDLKSTNGTTVDGKKLGITAKVLRHESVIEIHTTKISCHIHEGHDTCYGCEPGLIQSTSPNPSSVISAEPVIINHKQQLKSLQRKYGLEREKYVEKAEISVYNDRANERRKKVGSSSSGEKTEMASLDTSIASSNRGFKMLTKLGWNQGETLGKSTGGLREPVSNKF